jgi:hypothetical protein
MVTSYTVDVKSWKLIVSDACSLHSQLTQLILKRSADGVLHSVMWFLDLCHRSVGATPQLATWPLTGSLPAAHHRSRDWPTEYMSQPITARSPTRQQV